MPLFTSTFFYRQGSQGWTENWSTTAADIPSASQKAQSLAIALVAPRASQTVLQGFRISFATIPKARPGAFVKFVRQGTRGKLVAPDTSPDPAATAALVRATTEVNTVRGVLLRGMADDDVVRDPATLEADFGGAWLGLIADLRAALRGAGWGFASFDPLTTWSQITSMVADATTPGVWDLTLAPGTVPPDVDSYVHFRGVNKRQLPWVKGNFRVLALQPGPIAGFSISVRPDLQPAVKGGIDTSRMFWRPSGVALNLVIALQPIDWRKRSTGRPTSLTRGRAVGTRWRR